MFADSLLFLFFDKHAGSSPGMAGAAIGLLADDFIVVGNAERMKAEEGLPPKAYSRVPINGFRAFCRYRDGSSVLVSMAPLGGFLPAAFVVSSFITIVSRMAVSTAALS